MADSERAKARQNVISGLTMLLKASPAWNRTHSRAATIAASPVPLESFVSQVEEAMNDHFPDLKRYQSQFRELAGHLFKKPATPSDSCFLFELHLLKPQTVATLPPERMGSVADIIEAEAAQREMDGFGHISLENSKAQGVQCPKCGKVDLSRLNLNRSGLDDERFGKQYETNMDVEDTCQCRLKAEEEKEQKEKAAAKSHTTSGNFQLPEMPTQTAPLSGEAKTGNTVGQKRARSESP